MIFQFTLNGRMIPSDKLGKLWTHQWSVLRYCLNICLQTNEDQGYLLSVAGLRTEFHAKDI